MLRQLELNNGNCIGKRQCKEGSAMTQLTPEQDVFIDQVAGAIRHAGLRQPALLILDAGRPLTFIGGQLLWLLQPALSLLLPRKKISQMAQILEKPEGVLALVTRLETQDA